MSNRKKSLPKHAAKVQPRTRASRAPSTGIVAGLVLIIAAVFITYLPSINGDFILDDDMLLTKNELVQAPDGLLKFWFSTESHDYWPVTNTALWIQWRMWGMNS